MDHIQTTARDVSSQLVPVLRADVRPAKAEVDAWTDNLIRETRELMSAVLPLADNEMEFLHRLNGRGELAPEVLTPDTQMQAVIRSHPGLQWKALNVRKHFGL